MPKTLVPILISGLLAAGLFLIVFALGLGFPFLFLPAVPLLLAALKDNPKLALSAGGMASLITLAVIGPSACIMFLLFLALPSWYIARSALRWRPTSTGERQWFPLGITFSRLAFAGCILVALAVFVFTGQEGGLPRWLSDNIHDAFSDLQDEYGDVIDLMAGRLSFLVFSATIWLWSLSLFVYAWLANRVLVHKGLNQRPDFAIESFHIPAWLLGLLAISALASLIGGPSIAFLGKSTLVSLMLPYFLQGAALMHKTSLTWPIRRLLLFLIYLIILAQFWPALILSGIGLWQQIKCLSEGGTSTKS